MGWFWLGSDGEVAEVDAVGIVVSVGHCEPDVDAVAAPEGREGQGGLTAGACAAVHSVDAFLLYGVEGEEDGLVAGFVVANAAVVGPAYGDGVGFDDGIGGDAVGEVASRDLHLVVEKAERGPGAADDVLEVDVDKLGVGCAVGVFEGVVDDSFDFACELADDGDFGTMNGLFLSARVFGCHLFAQGHKAFE